MKKAGRTDCGIGAICIVFSTAVIGPMPAKADDVSTFAGFRHHFYRGLPNRGLPSRYDARRIGRGEDPYPGAESGYRR